eukprot:scaffold36811_cov17-Tisochrysis_lutea.AAC.1
MHAGGGGQGGGCAHADVSKVHGLFVQCSAGYCKQGRAVVATMKSCGSSNQHSRRNKSVDALVPGKNNKQAVPETFKFSFCMLYNTGEMALMLQH